MNDLIPVDLTALQRRAEPVSSGLLARANELSQRPLTLTVVTAAQEIDTEAKQWLEAWDKEHEPTKKALFEAHRRFTAFCNKMADGPKNARIIAKRLIGTWQLQEQRKAREETERIRREAEAAAKRAQQAEVNHLVEQAAATNDEALLAEAAVLEAKPVTPIVVTAAPPPKLAGTAVVEKKAGTVEAIVTLLEYLIDGKNQCMQPRLDLINELIEIKQGALDRAINRGLELPGVKVEIKIEVRNTERGF